MERGSGSGSFDTHIGLCQFQSFVLFVGMVQSEGLVGAEGDPGDEQLVELREIRDVPAEEDLELSPSSISSCKEAQAERQWQGWRKPLGPWSAAVSAAAARKQALTMLSNRSAMTFKPSSRCWRSSMALSASTRTWRGRKGQDERERRKRIYLLPNLPHPAGVNRGEEGIHVGDAGAPIALGIEEVARIPRMRRLPGQLLLLQHLGPRVGVVGTGEGKGNGGRGERRGVGLSKIQQEEEFIECVIALVSRGEGMEETVEKRRTRPPKRGLSGKTFLRFSSSSKASSGPKATRAAGRSSSR
eukprot:21130-Hanusia_phi.AAC.7